MIPRYTRPQMGAIWSDEAKYSSWLQVEIAATEAQCKLGNVPAQSLSNIKRSAKFDVQRIHEIEVEILHDVIAFLTSVNENLGEDARYIHVGLTSSDIIDTSLAIRMRDAGKLLKEDLRKLEEAILKQARKHKHTIMVGRSHGIHAEPTTLGYKLAIWLEEIRRNITRLDAAIEVISYGKLSGAIGTYSNISPEVEKIACELLGLKPCPVSTQVVQRDRHAEYLCTLALIGATLEKFAIEIRHLQRTDVLEVEEPFKDGQKGSSAMPHKRNPVGSENITGLARILRANAGAALEDVALWHERDISHSSVERIIVPDSTILLDFMLARMTDIIDNLAVYPENMRRNMEVFGGVIFSQSVLLKLVEKGMSREDAYKVVQAAAMGAWNKSDGNFKANLQADKNAIKLLKPEELDECFKPESHLRHIDVVFKRVGI
jgi:adenylosuccinate lyase